MYRTCFVSYFIEMLRVTGYYEYDTAVRVYITSNWHALNTHTHTLSLTHTPVPHRSQSTGAYPKSKPLEPKRRCSSSFAPPSKPQIENLLKEKERERVRRRSTSAPGARNLSEYLLTPATERWVRVLSTSLPPSRLFSALWSWLCTCATFHWYAFRTDSP